MPSVTVNGQDAGLQGRTAILVGQADARESCPMLIDPLPLGYRNNPYHCTCSRCCRRSPGHKRRTIRWPGMHECYVSYYSFGDTDTLIARAALQSHVPLLTVLLWRLVAHLLLSTQGIWHNPLLTPITLLVTALAGSRLGMSVVRTSGWWISISLCYWHRMLNHIQVGDVFLKNAYFSTDVGKNQISLAKLV